MMRKRLARKIYFPRDVGLAYRSTTLGRAFHRLRLGNASKWVKWSEFRARRLTAAQTAELDRRLDDMDAEIIVK
jgi:hypothetical protein